METAGMVFYTDQLPFLSLTVSAGSWALVGSKVSADSTVAAKLRENGLIILGKTSLSEWANFRSLNSSNGWSGRGGNTYGAYYPDQDPNGSSSGSAVATDLGLVPFALGTEVRQKLPSRLLIYANAKGLDRRLEVSCFQVIETTLWASSQLSG